MSQHRLPKLARLLSVVLICSLTSSCYFVNFFKKKKKKGASSDAAQNSIVLGRPLGAQAGGIDTAALEAIYSVTSELPPAPIRPDPDLYARRLLRQYRSEGSTVARAIGDIEGYRLLLGGASADFQKTPQDNFDATSLLANLTVAERICTGLVAPNATEHEGWSTILPAAASDWNTNIRFLAQRFIGKPSSTIDASIIDDLKAIFDAYNTDGNYSFGDYVPVCTTLALDAEALLL